MDRDPWSRLANWLAPSLLLVTPLVIFFRHQKYPLLLPESLLCMAVFAALGLVLAALGASFGDHLRLPILAALTTLFIDIQFQFSRGAATRLLQILYPTLIWCFLLYLGYRHRPLIAQFLSFVVGTVLVSSMVMPVSDTRQDNFALENVAPADRTLPPVVHLIMDEFIGIEGLPAEVDPDRLHAESWKRFFLDRGFDVYGKAYSMSTESRLSIGTMMDFQADPDAISERLSRTRSEERLGATAYFTEMARRGYQIHVDQSDYLGFCLSQKGEPVPGVQSCRTYILEHPALIGSSPLPMANKVGLILGMFSRLSFVLDELQSWYVDVQASPRGERLGLPEIQRAPRLSSIAVTPVFERLAVDLANAEPGHLYFAHLLQPHYPYAFDAECGVRPHPAEWLGPVFVGGDIGEERRRRYGLYIEQVQCTLRRLATLLEAMDANGRWSGAHVIVQGDHGSRIAQGGLFGQGGPPGNHLDKHATLFAFHRAGAPAKGRYLRDRAPINVLLPEVLGVPGRGLADWSGVPEVFMDNRTFVPMPDFEGGRVIATVNGGGK